MESPRPLFIVAAWIGLWAGVSPGADGWPSHSRLPVPEGIPRYEIGVRVDVARRLAIARERVRFTNRTTNEVRELVFHVYPRFRVADADWNLLGKTMEVLRLSPDEAMDRQGRRLSVQRASLDGKDLTVRFDEAVDTIMTLDLPSPVKPGASVEVEIDFRVELPDKWGRWGQHDGITYLANWYPVLAYHDQKGWEKTPFVPWHQPWHQEAGQYRVTVDLPSDQMVASTGSIVSTQQVDEGWKRLKIETAPARDFALVCSSRFQAFERKAGETRVRVLALPETAENAKACLDFACEVIPLYEAWFGPYFDEEFEIVTSYFGWNGNECAGLVMIDQRVMNLPSVGVRYLDHLVSHETLHQWFWNTVGTDGYAETFMDEGIVSAVTARRLDAKYGRNGSLVVWPRGLGWLPTIGREDMRLSGYYGWRAKGNGGPVLQDLKTMGNLSALFSLAYDRGGKVINMVENRLGPERFEAFFRKIYHDYAFKTLSFADFRRELAAFDPGQNWDDFLDGWLIEHADTDWSVERVSIGGADDKGVHPVTIEVKQKREMLEPTVVLCDCDASEIRVPLWPERGDYEVPGAKVSRKGDTWTIQVDAPVRPRQVEVDPDHALLDAVPDNNRWKPEVAWRVTPLMTPLDESSTFQAYDRISVVAGPFIDMYARGGFKVGIQRLEKWQLTAWAGTEPALREAIFGGQLLFPHTPFPRWVSGIFYEEGLYNFYNDKRHSGGRLFTRYKFLETSSFLTEDQGFAELYLGTGNEFWQGDDGRPVNGNLTAIGGRLRASTLFPVWDPVGGNLLELTVERGDRAIGSKYDYVRMTGEVGVVRALPESTGAYFSKTKLALRAYGGWAFPDDQPYFRLGGGRRLRGLDLTQYTGSAVWLGTAEWRFPIWADMNQGDPTGLLHGQNLFGSLFYDVGQSYLRGNFSPVVHSVGFGLRLDVSLFSFLERAALRMDIAQPIGIGRGPVLWFGLNQVF